MKKLRGNIQRASHVDHLKADSFSVAMSVMHAALLEPCFKIYHRSNLMINNDKLEELLEEIKEFYSDDFVRKLKRMLVFDTKLRATCESFIRMDKPSKSEYSHNTKSSLEFANSDKNSNNKLNRMNTKLKFSWKNTNIKN